MKWARLSRRLLRIFRPDPGNGARPRASGSWRAIVQDRVGIERIDVTPLLSVGSRSADVASVSPARGQTTGVLHLTELPCFERR